MSNLVPIAIILVVASIAIGLGATVLTDIQTDQTADSYAYNASGFGLEGINTLGSYVPTIALVAAVAIVLGILIFYLARRFT